MISNGIVVSRLANTVGRQYSWVFSSTSNNSRLGLVLSIYSLSWLKLSSKKLIILITNFISCKNTVFELKKYLKDSVLSSILLLNLRIINLIETEMSIFDNTQIAFADKTTDQLRKAYWMFKGIENPTLTNMGVSMLNFTVKNNFPFVDGIVKKTLFEQFCGGETREESIQAVNKLWKRGVGSIFDYSVEGKEDEESFDKICNEIKDIIKFSKGNPAIPFVVFKPTAFGRIDLYEEVGKGRELTTSEKKNGNV